MGIVVAKNAKSIKGWIKEHGTLVEFAGESILKRLADKKAGNLGTWPRVTNGDVAFDVRRWAQLGGVGVFEEWRLKNIISNAARFGAFRSLGVVNRRGVGWTHEEPGVRKHMKAVAS